jgi:hypothetical protein
MEPPRMTRKRAFLKFSSTERDVNELKCEAEKLHAERYGKVKNTIVSYSVAYFAPIVSPEKCEIPTNVKECVALAAKLSGQPTVDVVCY